MKWLFGVFKFILTCVLLLSLSCVPVSFGCPTANQPPSAVIDSITPEKSAAGTSISFAGHGTDPNGSVVAYRWRSSLDGEINTRTAFEKSDLSAGTHTIYFKVQDNNGAWSKEENKTIAITAAGAAGTPGGIAGIPLIAFFNANPTYIAAGGSSLLNWNVTGAATVSIDNGIGDVAAVGSQVVTPSVTTGYTLVAKNADGTNFARTQIVITSAGSGPPPPDVPVINQFVSDSDTLSGSYVTLSWNVSNATSITINPEVGNVAATGNRQVTPATTTVYTLTATNTVGSANRALQITVPGSGLTGPGVTGTVQQFKVTSVITAVIPSNWDSCPHTFRCSAMIRVSGPCTVTYVWERSDLGSSPQQTEYFTAAGSKEVSTGWPREVAGSYWVQVKILSPNSLVSNKANFTCGVVGTPPPTAAVTSVITAVTPTNYELECPYTFRCSAMIRVSGPCTVTYVWERSDLGSSPQQTEYFTAAGVKEVSTGWPREVSGNYWVRVKILSPNSLVSNQANFSVACFH